MDNTERPNGAIEETEGSKEPHLIPQEGGGALMSGGTPGNRGGGRPTNELRKLSCESFLDLKERLDRMVKVVEGMFDEESKSKHPHLTTILQAVNTLKGVADVMGRYGPGTRVEYKLEQAEWIDLSYQGVVECFPGQCEAHVVYADWLAKRIS